jgi:hypothetical protein
MFGDSLNFVVLTVRRGCKGGQRFQGMRALIDPLSFLASWQRSLEKAGLLAGVSSYLGLSRANSCYLGLSRVKNVAALLQARGWTELDGGMKENRPSVVRKNAT